jgi:predicted oxidoreductase (fatty acid repression mutant protein)
LSSAVKIYIQEIIQEKRRDLPAHFSIFPFLPVAFSRIFNKISSFLVWLALSSNDSTASYKKYNTVTAESHGKEKSLKNKYSPSIIEMI